MTTADIRQKYLDFFAARGHVIVPSASLLPENDPSTLFTGSGMQPMVPFLLGETHPLGTRIADSQKCFRSQDIDEVGDNRHTTFFEMLGNWSLGDYFKKEQIAWMYEFLTKEIGLDPNKLFVTVFRGNEELGLPRDEESAKLWQEKFGGDAQIVDFAERDGMQDGKIFYYPESKNWWSRSGVPQKMPLGEPGGPDTELFWDFGVDLGLHEKSSFAQEPCHVNCDCGRFMEIGNNVFMQYQKTADGFSSLPKQNVDFGGGLERIAAAANNNPDMFLIDVFADARAVIEHTSNKSYLSDTDTTYSFRVILDHIRAATFLIADGVLPSNKDQGYFVRRLIRRAVRFARRLGVERALIDQVAAAYIEQYQNAYPFLAEKKSDILSALTQEETKFGKTIAAGLRELKKKLESGSFTGTDAFDLYQSYGFPLELTVEELARDGQQVDHEQFRAEFEKHQALSRAGSEQKFAGGLADHSAETTRLHTATHLLHRALKTVLGDHVQQKGSNITAERLRFDFTHPTKMTDEEIKAVEDMVNKAISDDLPMRYEEMSVEQAKASGALGYFEDKYAQIGGNIKVYMAGDDARGYYSKEICGGPHVTHTGELGHFTLQKEEAVAAGIRRIKATVSGPTS